MAERRKMKEERKKEEKEEENRGNQAFQPIMERLNVRLGNVLLFR